MLQRFRKNNGITDTEDRSTDSPEITRILKDAFDGLENILEANEERQESTTPPARSPTPTAESTSVMPQEQKFSRNTTPAVNIANSTQTEQKVDEITPGAPPKIGSTKVSIANVPRMLNLKIEANSSDDDSEEKQIQIINNKVKIKKSTAHVKPMSVTFFRPVTPQVDKKESGSSSTTPTAESYQRTTSRNTLIEFNHGYRSTVVTPTATAELIYSEKCELFHEINKFIQTNQWFKPTAEVIKGYNTHKIEDEIKLQLEVIHKNQNHYDVDYAKVVIAYCNAEIESRNIDSALMAFESSYIIHDKKLSTNEAKMIEIYENTKKNARAPQPPLDKDAAEKFRQECQRLDPEFIKKEIENKQTKLEENKKLNSLISSQYSGPESTINKLAIEYNREINKLEKEILELKKNLNKILTSRNNLGSTLKTKEKVKADNAPAQIVGFGL